MNQEIASAAALLKKLNWPMLYETGGGHEFISDNFYAYTGYFSEEVKHNRDFFPSRIHPEDMPELNHIVTEWHKNGEREILFYSFRFKIANGDYIWIDDYLFEVKNLGNKFMRGILVISDKEHKEEIRLREMRFRLEESDGNSDQIKLINEQLHAIEKNRNNRFEDVQSLLESINREKILLEDIYSSHAPVQTFK